MPRPAALLLTGGASRRMGADKATLRVDGVPLAVRTARLLEALAGPCLEVGPGESGLPTVAEPQPGAGPLHAMAAGGRALAAFGRRPVLVVACDLPRLDLATLAVLAEWPGDGPAVPCIDGHDQPLCARWSADALDQAGVLAAGGERSLRRLLARDDVARLDERAFPDGGAGLADADTPADLERLRVAFDPG